MKLRQRGFWNYFFDCEMPVFVLAFVLDPIYYYYGSLVEIYFYDVPVYFFSPASVFLVITYFFYEG